MAVESTTANECLYYDACPRGGLECTEGYEDVLCNRCRGWVGDKFFARSGRFKCIACTSHALIAASMIGLFLVLLCYVLIMMRLIIAGASRVKDHSVLLRIITNYLQILLLLKELDLHWPPQVLAFYESMTFINSASTDIF